MPLCLDNSISAESVKVPELAVMPCFSVGAAGESHFLKPVSSIMPSEFKMVSFPVHVCMSAAATSIWSVYLFSCVAV